MAQFLKCSISILRPLLRLRHVLFKASLWLCIVVSCTIASPPCPKRRPIKAGSAVDLKDLQLLTFSHRVHLTGLEVNVWASASAGPV